MTECRHNNTKRDEEYDAYYCVDCGEWQESKCEDPECEFCSDRPERRQM